MEQRAILEMAASDLVIIVAGRGRQADPHIRAAVTGRKRILYWRPVGAGHLPVPRHLKGYAELRVVDGDEHAAMAAIREWEDEFNACC